MKATFVHLKEARKETNTQKEKRKARKQVNKFIMAKHSDLEDAEVDNVHSCILLKTNQYLTVVTYVYRRFRCAITMIHG